MRQPILALALAAVLAGCAAGDSTPTSQTEKVASTTASAQRDEPETTATANDPESSDQSEADAGEKKYKTVCINERTTGSRRRTRVCRDIEVTE